MRESRTLGSVRAKAEWLSYSTIPFTNSSFSLKTSITRSTKSSDRGVQRQHVSLPSLGCGFDSRRSLQVVRSSVAQLAEATDRDSVQWEFESPRSYQRDGGSNPPGRSQSSGSSSVSEASMTYYVPGVLGRQGLQSPSSRVRFLVPVPVVSSEAKY